MADTFTSLLRLRKIEQGAQTDVWGPLLNTGFFEMVEEALNGYCLVDVTAGNVTLSSANGTTDQARCAIVMAIGSPGVTRTITAPVTSKVYLVRNVTANNLVFRAGGGDPGLTVYPSTTVLCFVDASTPNMTAIETVVQPVTAGAATGSVTPSISDRTAGDTTVTVRYFKQGRTIIAQFATFSSTISTANPDINIDLAATALPSNCYPAAGMGSYSWGTVLQAGVEVPSILSVNAAGTCKIYRADGANWTAATVRSVPYNWTVAWNSA